MMLAVVVAVQTKTIAHVSNDEKGIRISGGCSSLTVLHAQCLLSFNYLCRWP
jgi:hypothetical protein